MHRWYKCNVKYGLRHVYMVYNRSSKKRARLTLSPKQDIYIHVSYQHSYIMRIPIYNIWRLWKSRHELIKIKNLHIRYRYIALTFSKIVS